VSDVGATLLAVAGLKRLGLAHRARAILDDDTFLPAPGQGAIAITARSVDTRTFQTWTTARR
jgi:hydroxymethylbilane synthase